MMQDMLKMLLEIGVDEQNIHYESWWWNKKYTQRNRLKKSKQKLISIYSKPSNMHNFWLEFAIDFM